MSTSQLYILVFDIFDYKTELLSSEFQYKCFCKRRLMWNIKGSVCLSFSLRHVSTLSVGSRQCLWLKFMKCPAAGLSWRLNCESNERIVPLWKLFSIFIAINSCRSRCPGSTPSIIYYHPETQQQQLQKQVEIFTAQSCTKLKTCRQESGTLC